MARVTVCSHFHKSPSQTKEVPSNLYTGQQHPIEGCWKAFLSKFPPFHHSENIPFELVETQTICWFSGRRFSPKLLFALAAMTQGEEFEQCQCITDSFPPRETRFQTTLKTLYHLIIPRWEICQNIPCCFSEGSSLSYTWNSIFFKQTNKWKTHQMFSVNRDRRPITDEGGHPLKPVIVCEHNLIFTLLSFPMIVLCLYRIPKGLLSAQMRVSPSCKGSKCNVPLSSGKWTAWKAKTRTFCCGINSHSNGLENTQYA